MTLGTALIRATVGPLFVGHGTQKLFGWFEGHGPEGTGGFFESLGLRPGRRHAHAAGLAETAGGALLTLGALTPVATSMLTATMLTAIRKVHLKNGPWAANGGYEYNLVLVAALTALAGAGPGRPSVDSALFPRLKGTGWAALSLGAGVAGSYLATSPWMNEPEPAEAPLEAEPAEPAVPVAAEGREDRFAREVPAQQASSDEA